MAGNQPGRRLQDGFEAAMHATGLYPDWWRGRRFDRPRYRMGMRCNRRSSHETPCSVSWSDDRESTARARSRRMRFVDLVAARGTPDSARYDQD